MKIFGIFRLAAFAGLAWALLLGLGTQAEAQKKIKWKMQSTFGSTLTHLGPSALRFVEDLKLMSGGKFLVKFFEPNALVPSLECFDAAAKGSVESCWTTPGYHAGKIPAVQFFTAVPFGPGFGEFMAWKWFGGGDDLKNEIYGKHGLISFDALCIGPETSGWFKKPVKSLDELRGMKMRFFGLGALVMQKLGVSTQLLAAAEIYPALERGVIDATEFSMPNMDIKLGFYQIAKNNYYPGWHQQVSCSEFLMNKAKYEALPKTYQAMIWTAARAQAAYTYAETEAQNFKAMGEMKSKYSVINRRWTDKQLAVFEKAWFEVIAEKSAKDPLFKKVADHYLNFRKEYKLWGDAQSLDATYQ
jgi:TRAP-type mannitol/chloroaromatic compound transport system substrate-binding protein